MSGHSTRRREVASKQGFLNDVSMLRKACADNAAGDGLDQAPSPGSSPWFISYDKIAIDATDDLNYSCDRLPTSWHNALRSNHGSLGCPPRFARPGAAPNAWAPGTMTVAFVTDAVNTPYGIAKAGILHGYAQKKANHWGDGLGSGNVG
jgi:hypothetical protein